MKNLLECSIFHNEMFKIGQTCAKAAPVPVFIIQVGFVMSKFHDNYFELCVVVSKFFSPWSQLGFGLWCSILVWVNMGFTLLLFLCCEILRFLLNWVVVGFKFYVKTNLVLNWVQDLYSLSIFHVHGWGWETMNTLCYMW